MKGTVTERGRARKGDRAECPKCHRWVGYWPGKLNPYRVYFMRHRTGQWCGGEAYGPWCDGPESVG